ncbi:GAK system ATP-grasp enzyme [Gayadomonas joobiniege]|uniref:GAK system ATP-grasp enzyme n=1 Tax=Gayadomonas joobiniege TaxID=1234606 RepID=UPI0003626C75|nr:GAK system ATP-grasp enzyme [Gayadomonas joobiniege]
MVNLKIAVIGLPGKWSSEKLADAIEEKTGFRLLIDMADIRFDSDTQSLWHQEQNLAELDAVMVKKISPEYNPQVIDRLELLRILEVQGVRVFSPADSIIGLINRLSCTITLCKQQIPMPPTQVTESVEQAIKIVKEYQEAVFKPLFSSKARGMFVAKASTPEAELRAQISEFNAEHRSMYIQKKLALPGKDLGLVFLGGEYLGTYARVSGSDTWNTTINSGGKYASYQPSEKIIDIAQRAQAAFNMDFTTVDVAESELGPVVFEVSAFGGFRGALEGAGIDAASLYVDYVLKELRSAQ